MRRSAGGGGHGSRRGVGLLGLARVLAWGAGYGAMFVVVYYYPALPDELPLTRWTAAPKTMFFAARVPLINLAMIGVCELLARALNRVPAELRQAGERAAAALLCTAGVKAWLAAEALVELPDAAPIRSAARFVSVVVGLCLAAWFARPLVGRGLLGFTRAEQVIGAVFLIVIAVSNLPLVVPHVFF